MPPQLQESVGRVGDIRTYIRKDQVLHHMRLLAPPAHLECLLHVATWNHTSERFTCDSASSVLTFFQYKTNRGGRGGSRGGWGSGGRGGGRRSGAGGGHGGSSGGGAGTK